MNRLLRITALLAAVAAWGCTDGDDGNNGGGADQGMGGAGGGMGGAGGGMGGAGGGMGGAGGGMGGAGGAGGGMGGAGGGQGGAGGGMGGAGGGQGGTKLFGEACQVPAGCDPESPRWPECTGDECASGECTIPGLDGQIGFCNRECLRNEFCEGAADGPYGTRFTCMTNDVAGTCAPGSGRRCDGAANGMCPDEGEVCVFQLVFGADATYGATCQPPHPDGVGPGEACSDEGPFCANGNCIYGACRNFCDIEAENSSCSDAEQCFDLSLSSDGSVTIEMCLPKYCEADDECPGDMICNIALDFGGEPFIVGFCALPSGAPSAVGPGEQCDDERAPCEVLCLGEGQDSYCAHMCADDSDCVNGTCSVVNFGIGNNQSAPARICVPATGSGRPCAGNADCAADGEIPEEACEYVLRQPLSQGRPQGEEFAEGRCAAIPAGAVEIGDVCGADAPCRSESLCLTGAGGNFCSATCNATAQCPQGFVCGGLRLSDNVVAGACILDGGSLAACQADADCEAEGEYCAYNALPGPDGLVLEQLCRLGREGGAAAGQDCSQNNECLSRICEARSTRIADPGYCLGACTASEQCSEDGSITCEQFLISQGEDLESTEDDLRGGFCVPQTLCGTCTFDGTEPCGGGFVCSAVRFPRPNADSLIGGACLPPCEGPDAECPAGHTCTQTTDRMGNAIEGVFSCLPDAPNDTCLSARPRL